MPFYIINPLDIKSEEELIILQSILRRYSNMGAWKDYRKYSAEGNFVQLTHRVISVPDSISPHGCNLFLMSTLPMQTSNEKELYLYKTDGGICYKMQNTEQPFFLTDPVIIESLKDAKFDQDAGNPEKCTVEDIIKPVLTETSKRGHTPPHIKKYKIVSSNPMYKTDSVMVSPIQCEMSFPRSGVVHYEQTAQPMIAKIQWEMLTIDMLDSFLQRARHEFTYSKMMEHLGVESHSSLSYPSADGQMELAESAMVLKLMPGIELCTFIEECESQGLYLPTTLLIKVFLEILRAFKKMCQSDIYNGDLKLENMILDLGTGNILPKRFNDNHVRDAQVKLVDFAGSQKLGEAVENLTTSPYYRAPEIKKWLDEEDYIELDDGTRLFPPILDEKTDLYSLGQAFRALLGLPTEGALPSDDSELRHLVFNMHKDLSKKEPNWVTKSCLFSMVALIRDMTYEDRGQRMSLDEALPTIESIITDYFAPNTKSLFTNLDGASSVIHFNDVDDKMVINQDDNTDKITPTTVTSLYDSVFSPTNISNNPFKMFSSPPPIMDVLTLADEKQNIAKHK